MLFGDSLIGYGVLLEEQDMMHVVLSSYTFLLQYQQSKSIVPHINTNIQFYDCLHHTP
jgi:hypothetical protein